ncbi:hypothetical protein HN827_05340, partial [archaeon]|nr:hypothetical protein [archaeon]
MSIENNQKASINPLMHYYLQYGEESRSETIRDILKTDLTDQLYTELKLRIKRNNLITISVRGEVTSGKSTVALALKHYINKLIVELGKNTKIDEYETICSDQIEFNRAIMSGKTNICYVVDEWSQLGQSGLGSTTENNLFEFYTDVCAQRFFHRIMCTPKANNFYDTASAILLDVIGKNTKEKFTLCRLLYNDPTSPMVAVPLGSVRIYVDEILNEDWYLRYREKKFRRIDLLDKYGIKDIRELESSKITLKGYNDLIDLCSMTSKFTLEIVTLAIKNLMNEEKILYSILQLNDIANNVKGLLNAKQQIEKMKSQLNKPLDVERKIAFEKTIK